MFTESDYDKLQQIMSQSCENRTLIQKLLDSHREDISTISHEIRNPLTLVYSTLQLIETQHPEVTTFCHWNSLRNDIEYMKQLLEELSSFNNSSKISIREFDFRKFMEQLAISFAISLEEKDIEFTSCIDPSLPVVHADYIKLKEVFYNLLKNAADAVSSNGSIRLDARVSNSNIVVMVKDNGCGIDASEIENIFLPFITHKEGGTGLGLAIARRSVEAHNGCIKVQSSKDRGTVFTVMLPI